MGLEQEQEPDGLGHVGFDVGLVFILRVESLEQVVGVEIEDWGRHDLIYAGKMGN